ncbi:MAG TPA: hypothetical protein VMX94_07495 [Armatimonadota bacterium]|nr:hypothetical protein [Armatimonadota bacterium]
MRRVSFLIACLLALGMLALMVTEVNAATVGVFSIYEYVGLGVAGRVSSLGYSTILWTNPSMITPECLAGVDVLYVLTGSAASLAGRASVIESYVAGGGGLIVEQANVEGPVAILPPGLGISVNSRSYDDLNVQITPAGLTHPITAGLAASDLSGNMDKVLLVDVAPAYSILAVGASDPNLVAIAAATYGNGRVVFETGNSHPSSLRPGSDAYLSQLIDWAAAPAATEQVVSIDIKPGDDVNSINLTSKGVVPVAVLTTPEFDAMTLDPSTVLFAEAAPVRWRVEDIDCDGDTDMLFHFRTQSLNLTRESSEASLVGSTYDGQSIRGTDSVNIVPPKE